MPKNKHKRAPKTVLRLPDLDSIGIEPGQPRHA
jgi:hypothetical protein